MFQGNEGMDEKKEKETAPIIYEQGVVEIIFKKEAKVRLAPIPAGSKAKWMLKSKTEMDLNPLEKMLSEIEVTKVVKIFTNSTEEEYDALHKKILEKATEKEHVTPNLNDFFAIHFPPNRDPVEVAKMFSKLPMIEKVYPVEKTVPANGIPDNYEYRRAERFEEYCNFMQIIGPCSYAHIIDTRWWLWNTPLNEPLVGDRDTTYTVDTTRNLENQWYIFRCNANLAWPLATGRGVVIADIDWGFRTTHEDLEPRFDMDNAYNSFDGSTTVDVGANVNHGTGVTGLAGAADNNLGMIGFAYHSTMWPIQGNDGPGPALGGNSWARAIDWVRARETTSRKVIILEVQTGAFGNIESDLAVNAAIVNAIADNVVVCVAAGNGNRNAGQTFDMWGNVIPIPFTGSIVVAATRYDPNDNPREPSSNWGPRVDVAAPGDPNHDLTCHNAADDAYTMNLGRTSGATPKVAGTVAMMLECNPSLTPAEVREIIRDTAGDVVTAANRPIGGFLDTEAAVREACRRAEPCAASLIIDGCRQMKVITDCESSSIVDACRKINILYDPCRLKSIVDIGIGCVRDRIIVGPCCIRELIAGTPFYHDDIFIDWNTSIKELKDKTRKHFRRLTEKR